MTDSVSRQSYLARLAILAQAAFAEWVRMDPIQFAETVLRMPGLHGSTQKFSLDFFPPQREMYLELFNPRNREVVFKIASRLTKTMTVLAAIGYFIKESPRKIGVMWPKIGDGEEWSKKQFMGELVDPTPEIAALITDGRGRRLANNTILSKIFPGGYLSIFGANVPGDLRRFKGNFLYADEIDAISITETDEGDQLRQFAVRGSEYPDTVQVYSSFPSLKGQSNIDAKYERSDKRVWEVPCAKCGDPWVMNRKDLRYDKEKTEEAKLECPNCHALHTDPERYKISRAGRWVATAEFKGVGGFHANALLWPHPIDLEKYPGGFLQMLALEEVAAEQADNPERARRVIVNTRDAESYQPEHLQKIEHSALYKRREKYDPREELPAEVVFITFGADLQSNRAEIKFKGWGQRDVASDSKPVKQSWALDYRIVRGSPLQAEFWEKLENVFRNVAWKHPSGQWIRPSLGLLDASYRPDEVYAFGRRMQKLRIYACEGAEQLGKAIVQKKPIKRGVPPALVWEIGTHEAKDIIYQQLEISDPAAQGFNHYPEIACFSENYFHGLTIEESTMERGRDGRFYRWFFKKSNDDRNEPLDCEVYANAAEQIYRPNYEKLAEQFAIREQETPEPDPNPDRNLPTARARMNRTGSRWMAGFRKI
jgi:phage terminase large subunit GpA-like protein